MFHVEQWDLKNGYLDVLRWNVPRGTFEDRKLRTLIEQIIS